MKLSRNEKRMLWVLCGVVILGGIIFYNGRVPEEIEIPFKYLKKEETGKQKTVKNTQSTGGNFSAVPLGRSRTSSTSLLMSAREFEEHNSEESCWVLINGQVYDITAYLRESSHPEEVAPFCGTFAFEEGYLSGSLDEDDILVEGTLLKGIIR